MRIRGYSEETESYTEDVEVLSGAIADLTKTASTPGGISLFTDETKQTYKSTYQLLEEISEIYDDLSDKTQAELLETLAGKRNGQALAAIVNNFDAAKKSMESMANSQGNAMKEMEIIYDSLDYKINRLKETWVGLSQDFIDRDVFKGLVDGLTSVLELIEKCGGLTPIVISLAGAFVTLKVAQASLNAGSVIGGISSMVKSMTTLTVATETATGATLALSAASKGLIVGGIVAGVMAIGYGINYVATSAERAEQKISDLRNKISEISSTNKSIEELSNRYDELTKSSELSTEEQQELVDVQNKLKEQLPEISGYYDAEGNFIVTNTQQIRDNIQANKDLIEVKSELLSKKQSEKVDNTLDDIENYTKMSDEIRKYIELKNKLASTSSNSMYMTNEELSEMGYSNEDIELLNKLDNVYGSVENAMSDLEVSTKELNDSYAELRQEYNDLITNSDSYKNATVENQKAIQDAISKTDINILKKNAPKLKEDVNAFVNDITNGISEIKIDISPVAESIDKTTSSTQDANEAFKTMLETFNSGETDILKTALDELNTSMKLSESTSEKLASKYPNIFDGCETAIDGISALNKQLAINKFDETTDDIASLVSILEDLEAGNGITASSFKKLSETFPDLLGYMSDEATLADAINNKMNDLKDTQKQAYAEMLMASDDYYQQKINSDSAWVTATENNLNSLLASLGSGYNIDLNNYKNMEEAKAKITNQLIKDLGKAWADYFGMISDGMSLGEIEESMYINGDESLGTNMNYEAYNQAKKIYDSFKKISDSFANFEAPEIKVGGTKSSGSSSDASKKIKEQFDAAVAEIQAGKKALENEISKVEAKIEVATLKGDTKSLDELTDKMTLLIAKRKELTEAENVEYSKLKSIYKDKELLAELDELMCNNSILWWDERKGQLENEIELIEKKYNIEKRAYDDMLKDIEYKQAFLSEDSSEYIALEQQKVDNILDIQNDLYAAISDLRSKGYKEESDEVRKYKDLWYDYEMERINIVKASAERIRQAEIDALSDKKELLNEQKKATEDLLKLTMDMIKQELDAKKKAIQEEISERDKATKKELDSYKKIIDAKKQALQDQKDERSYEKGLSEKQKNVKDTEDKLLALELDNSLKAQAEKKRLEEELKKYKEELDDYQYEHSVDQQLDALDKEYEIYEEAKNKELDAFKEQKEEELKLIEKQTAQENNIRKAAMEYLKKEGKNAYSELLKYSQEYTDMSQKDFDEMWTLANEAIDTYSNSSNNLIDIMSALADEMKRVADESERIKNQSWTEFVDDKESLTPNSSNKPSDDKYGGSSSKEEREEYRDKQLQKMIELGDEMNDEKDHEKIKKLKEQQEAIAKTIGAYNQDGTWYILINGKKVRVREAVGMRHNGLLGGRVGDGLKPNEKLMKLTQDEWVFTGKQFSNLTKNIDNLLSSKGSNPISITIEKIMDVAHIDKDVNVDDLVNKATKAMYKSLNSTFKLNGFSI